MPLSPNFSASQSYSSPSVINLLDTSTGSDVTIVSRRVSLLTASGTYLVPTGNSSTQYITWLLANTSISIDALGTKDWALSVKVDWLDVSSAVVETKTIVLGFTVFNENFDFTLSQMLSGNSPLMNDNGFFEKKSLLRTYIDSGNQAVAIASDYLTAQICYDEATKIRDKSQYLFNINS